jgi:hypothetical protein
VASNVEHSGFAIVGSVRLAGEDLEEGLPIDGEVVAAAQLDDRTSNVDTRPPRRPKEKLSHEQRPKPETSTSAEHARAKKLRDLIRRDDPLGPEHTTAKAPESPSEGHPASVSAILSEVGDAITNGVSAMVSG